LLVKGEIGELLVFVLRVEGESILGERGLLSKGLTVFNRAGFLSS
jgi:hypothetical protein